MSCEQLTTINKSLYGKYRRDLKVNNILCIISAIVLAILACVIFMNRFVLIKVCIEGTSMQPTLYEGDIVSLNTYAQPTYGDVIVIEGEKSFSKDWIIKRAIAFGGDEVKIEGGYVYLKKAGEEDFTKLFEPYLYKQGITFFPTVSDETNTEAKDWTIPEGYIFYLGDNRQHSADSRSYFGTCAKEQVVGVVSDLALKFKGVTTFLNSVSIAINDFFAGKN